MITVKRMSDRYFEVRSDKKTPAVDVYIPNESFGMFNIGGINWAAYGTQEIEFTQEFIEMLQEAVKIYEKGRVEYDKKEKKLSRRKG